MQDFLEAHLFGISPFGEDSHALPLTSELDALLGGECDPDSARRAHRTRSEGGVAPPDHEKSTPIGVLVV